VEVGEPDTFIVQAVHLRRLEDGIAGAGKIAVTLIVGKDNDDVRPSA
jgi:hypothetical protein